MNRNKDNNVVKKILVVGAGLFGSVFAHEAAKKVTKSK